MLTMYLCSKGSKETIIWSSPYTIVSWSSSNWMKLYASHIDATVTKASKQLHMLRVLSRPGIEVKDSYNLYILDRICIRILSCSMAPHPYLLPLWRGRIYTEMHPQDHQTRTFMQMYEMSKTTQIGWKAKWTLSRYHPKDTKRETTLQTSHYDEGVCTPLPSRELYNTNTYNWKIIS